MKKISLVVISVAIIAVITFLHQETKKTQKKKFTFTSAEIIQQEKDAKILRRQNGYSKPDKPDKYVEYLKSLRTGYGKKDYDANYKLIAYKEALAHKKSLKSAAVDLPWVQRGPGNVGGRTRAIIVDPSDPANIWYAGAISGGVWKTIDAGANWTLISPDLPNLSISSLAMAPSNNNVIYAGTGEGYYNIDAVRGQGIFKSTDRGVTWNQLSATATGSAYNYINSMAISSADENLLWAATNYAVVISLNGGENWYDATPDQGGYGRYQKIVKHPTNDEVLWVAKNDVGIFKTINGGKDWYLVKKMAGEKRIQLVISEKNPNVLYALNQDSKLYISKDGGEEWAEAKESGTATDFLGGQGWYNNTIALDPTNEFKGFIGGVDFYNFTVGADALDDGKVAFTTSIDAEISSLLEFDNFKGTHSGGGAKFYSAYDAFENISIQFGSGMTQKSHRFIHKTDPSFFTNDISVDIDSLSYQDYVGVPFKVFNTTTNTQLTASFIDANENGVFDLYDGSYEPIIIHDDVYNESLSNASVIAYKGKILLLAAVYPQLVLGATWDETTLPTGSIHINTYELKNKVLIASRLTKWSADVTANNYSHADHHNITIIPEGGTPFGILVGNDGGLSFSADGGSIWATKINGYVTSQFYGVSRHPSQYQYFGGLQDNGSYLSGLNPNIQSSWTEVLGGDGFDVVWHSRNPQKMMGSIYYNKLMRSLDGGMHWPDISNKIEDNTADNAPFFTKIASSSYDPDLLFVGGASGVWKSSDFGDNWKKIPMGADWGFGGGALSIAISLANPEIVWAGNAMDEGTGKVYVSTNRGDSFNTVPVAMNLGAITNIVTHPNDANTAYVLFSYSGWPKVFRTTDLGQSWEDISGFNYIDGDGNLQYGSKNSNNGFPNVAVNTLLVMPFNNQEIWAGTEIGLFISYDNGANWQYADNGMPAVSIWDMKIVGDEIVVGTHGLGVWSVKKDELSNGFKNPYISTVVFNPDGHIVFETKVDEVMDKMEIYLDGSLYKTKNNIAVGSRIDTIYKEDYNQENRLRVITYQGTSQYSSNVKDIPDNPYFDPINSYLNNFSTEYNDFFGNGFAINSVNLNDNAIVTAHPYTEKEDYYYYLKYPIVVSETQNLAFIKYDDIAFIETGEPGVEYPSPEFYDYVVVEATTDGINWEALAPGYDFNYSSTWSVGGKTYGSTPSPNQFVTHEINLYDKYAGKTILIRFKLHSDDLETGWGWAIDNLRIQDDFSGIFNKKKASFEILLAPNPTSNSINLSVDDLFVGDIHVVVRTVTGKVVYQEQVFKESGKFSKLISPNWPSKGNYIITIQMDGKESSKVLVVK